MLGLDEQTLERRSLARNETLFRQGEKVTAIYFVEAGRLRLERRTLVLGTTLSGNFFVEANAMSFLSLVAHQAEAAFLIPFLDVFGLALLLVAVAGFIAARHGCLPLMARLPNPATRSDAPGSAFVNLSRSSVDLRLKSGISHEI